jgi:DNA-directed RNA polymerase I, II, and III subunit RPABC2
MSAFNDEPDIFDESDVEEEIDEPSEGLTNKNKVKQDNDDEDGIDDDDDDEDEDEDHDEDIQDDEENDDDNNDDSNDLNTNNDVNRQQNMFDFNTDSDSDSDEEDGYDYLQKFDENTSKKVLENYYPEHIQHNYDEIEKMTKIVRNEEGDIIDPLHKTLPILTKYERARIIGERAKQLDCGAKPLIPIEPNEIDSYMIALKEFGEKKIPFIIKRPLPNGSCEYWKLADLEVLI